MFLLQYNCYTTLLTGNFGLRNYNQLIIGYCTQLSNATITCKPANNNLTFTTRDIFAREILVTFKYVISLKVTLKVIVATHRTSSILYPPLSHVGLYLANDTHYLIWWDKHLRFDICYWVFLECKLLLLRISSTNAVNMWSCMLALQVNFSPLAS